MRVEEIAVVFDCEGSQLVGVVHRPETLHTRGMLSIVAGGPQYRGGVCRMQVQMARELAARGVPVMRFDYRGLGDSEGEFRGFCHVEADIAAAIKAFRSQAPGLKDIVLWGGCDAASAVLMNAWKYPEVTGIVLGNPWVHSSNTSDTVALQHYSQRIKDKDFWLKVVRLQYNPLPALGTLLRRALSRLNPGGGARAAAPGPARDDPSLPFQLRMRLGMSRFRGDVLLLMSGRSLLSREFDVLLAEDAAWQQAVRSPRAVVRWDIEDGDQAFSTLAAREEVNRVTGQWMLDPRSLPANPPAGPA